MSVRGKETYFVEKKPKRWMLIHFQCRPNLKPIQRQLKLYIRNDLLFLTIQLPYLPTNVSLAENRNSFQAPSNLKWEGNKGASSQHHHRFTVSGNNKARILSQSTDPARRVGRAVGDV